MINSYTSNYNYNSHPSVNLWPDFIYFCFPEIQQSSASTETHIGICQNLCITFLNIVDRVSLHLKNCFPGNFIQRFLFIKIEFGHSIALILVILNSRN